MAARFPVGSIALASAFVISIFDIMGFSGAARATDCLAAPGSPAPANSHWYYRTDRTQGRKCWYLRAVDGRSQEGTANAAQTVPAAAPHSLARFKDFLAQRGNANLSDKEVAQLYAAFLAWSRRPQNEAKERP
jgi:hypothetical protein